MITKKTEVYDLEVHMKDGSRKDLLDVLPHGSGIDLKWRFYANEQNIYAYNAWHCMNEHGYYDGWADFSIVFPQNSTNLRDDFALHFHGDIAQRKNKQYMLREYLEDTFVYVFSQIKSIAGFSYD